MLQFNVAIADCEWQLVEETATDVREQGEAGTGVGARNRTTADTGERGAVKVGGKEDRTWKQLREEGDDGATRGGD